MEHVARLVIVHSSHIFEECLTWVLSGVPGLHVSHVDPGNGDFLEAVVAESPDLILVDVGLAENGAVELTRQARRRLPSVRVLVLAKASGDEDLYDCFAAGIHGCVLDNTSVAELKTAVQTMLRGEAYCSPRLVHEMFRRMTQPGFEPRHAGQDEQGALTRREQEIIELIAQRLSNKEIAKRLFVSLHTVKNHVHNIVEKLKASDRFDAVKIARERGRENRGNRPWLNGGRLR